MFKKNIFFIFLCALLYITSYSPVFSYTPGRTQETPPQLTVVIVIDQFAYHYFEKLHPYFTHGFKQLLKHGIVFTDAHHPHGAPTTATGHAAIGTGTIARHHGIILNGWWANTQNKSVEADETKNNCLTDSLSDQVARFAHTSKKPIIYSLSYKKRAAMGMAGKMGIAIWFDIEKQQFVTSTEYAPALPAWVRNFNQKYSILKHKEIPWTLRFPASDAAYNFPHIKDYSHASAQPIVQTKIPVQLNSEEWIKTPFANQYLLNLGKAYLDTFYTKFRKNTCLLWISLSSLDKVGHPYGPHSLEVIDMIYHLDKQIYDFMSYTQNLVGRRNILFVLTADHGVIPIPEIMQKDGYTNAYRVLADNLVNGMNKLIEEKYHLSPIIKKHKTNSFYCNKEIMDTLSHKEQKKILHELKQYLEAQPGIKACFTKRDFAHKTYLLGELEQYVKNQFFNTRSGDLVCIPHPHSLIIQYPGGTAHRSPYDYDTHVPLIFYQPGVYQNKSIQEHVEIPQLAVTLAHILQVPKPAAAYKPILPGF